MVEWFAELQGADAEDEATLVALRLAPGARIIAEAGKLYLHLPGWQESTDRRDVEQAAIRIISLLNGAFILSNRPPVKIAEIGRVTADGRRVNVHQASLEMRLRIVRAGWTPEDDEEPRRRFVADVTSRLALAARDTNVEQVLRLLSSFPQTNWVDLYKIYELVNHDQNIVRRGWATKKQLDRFTHAANDPRATGDQSRHSVPNSDTPPKNPMMLPEANGFIWGLVQQWLGEKNVASITVNDASDIGTSTVGQES